jgi:peptide/nickel transport system substrate-binding protein
VETTNYWAASRASRLSRRRLLQGAGVAGAGLAGLTVACGTKGTTTTSKSAPSSTAAQQPKRGGQFNLAVDIDPYNFDPTAAPLQNGPWIELANQALLSIKHGAGVGYTDLTIQPGLAAKWETPDAQTFTFHLTPNVHWQNLAPVNGRALTSDDVKFSMEYQSRTGQFKDFKTFPSLNLTNYEGLDSVQTPDPSTVVIHFSTPFVPFLQHMSLERNGIVAHEVYDRDGDFSKTLVGTGMWQLDTASSQHGTKWVMVRNPGYVQSDHPYIDKVNFLVIPDQSTCIAAFQTKQIDLLNQSKITPDTAPGIARANPQAVDWPFNDTSGGLLFENVKRAPLNDMRVRQAMHLAIDRDAFLKTFSAGKGEWAIAGGYPGLFSSDEVHSMLKYDPQQAKQLLSAAGYGNGLTIEFHYSPTRGTVTTNKIQLIQSQLKAIGVNVMLKSEDEATYSKNQRSGDFFLDYEAKPEVGDIDSYIYYNWFSKSVGNFGGVADPELDALLKQQRQEVDPNKRKDVLRQAVKMILDKAYYTAFIYGQNHFFWEPYVKNFAPNIAHYAPPIYDSWIAE